MSSHYAYLPPALSGELHSLQSPVGKLSYYVADTGVSAGISGTSTVPLLLIHTVNAAGSAYEIRPLFEHYRNSRPVYALELPGFGMSERSKRRYTPRLMTDSLHVMVEEIRHKHGAVSIDGLAVSLSAEFLARAVTEKPAMFRTVGLVSPTGFDRRTPRDGPPGSTRGMALLRAFFTVPPWSRALFELLTKPGSVRYFLERTWGSKQIDEGLLDYSCLTTRQPGAEHAPFDFIAGYLFSADIHRLYQALTLPVWMAHGIRGDFVDYRYKTTVEDKPNWTIQVFPTGALPHFEELEQFTAGYDAFLALNGK